jgi:hypothetical protein
MMVMVVSSILEAFGSDIDGRGPITQLSTYYQKGMFLELFFEEQAF